MLVFGPENNVEIQTAGEMLHPKIIVHLLFSLASLFAFFCFGLLGGPSLRRCRARNVTFESLFSLNTSRLVCARLQVKLFTLKSSSNLQCIDYIDSCLLWQTLEHLHCFADRTIGPAGPFYNSSTHQTRLYRNETKGQVTKQRGCPNEYEKEGNKSIHPGGEVQCPNGPNAPLLDYMCTDEGAHRSMTLLTD